MTSVYSKHPDGGMDANRSTCPRVRGDPHRTFDLRITGYWGHPPAPGMGGAVVLE